MDALGGVGVLVTRPAHQAAPLCRLLESHGATVVRMPAIDIKPGIDTGLLKTRLASPEAFDLVIFTSANAVRFGVALLESHPTVKLAAIGPATARALEASGFQVAAVPPSAHDSEHLLGHPALAHVDGKRVLIVKGLNGRETLQDELARRGAHVTVAEVYRREPARYSAAELAALQAQFAAGDIQIVTATSAEIAASVLVMATPALRLAFGRATWLVPGTRVAHALRENGLTAPIVQAASALDQDLVAALIRWRSSESGA